MRVIWKFKVRHGAEGTINVPKGSQLLHAEVVGVDVWVWALCDPRQEKYDRPVGWFITGDEVPEGWQHVSTFITDREPESGVQTVDYVAHVFDGLGAR
jgi:hypothetical protein